MKIRNGILIVMLLSLFIVSCRDDNENQGVIDSIKVNIVDTFQIQNPNDIELEKTRIIVDTQVLFFMPSPKEKQELFKFYGTYNQYEFQTVFTNFSLLSRNVKSTLQPYGINVEVTYSTEFVFPMQDDTLVYNLELEGQFMGYILSDGQNMPLIKNGVQKSKDVSNDIRNYFNIANFSLY
jgi:hypothetical protein